MTIVGTRPEIIRLSAVIDRLETHTDHVLVHTGQNYDPTLNQVFFDDLGLRAPDHIMRTDTTTLGSVLGTILTETERVLDMVRPDAVVVLGDTNSCLSALIAKRKRIPVFHLEAGNRSFDENVPEETNRRLVDHVSDYNLVYTEHARRNLLAEGIPADRIGVVGSPRAEVRSASAPGIAASTVLDDLELHPGSYFLVSLHREENVDDESQLRLALASLRAISDEYGLPVLVSTHPRTRKRLDALEASATHGILFHPPFGFLNYNALQMNARCVLSDSGTVSEESAILGFPAVTLRERIERPEAIDSGSIVTSGLYPEAVLDTVRFVLAEAEADAARRADVPDAYRVTDTSRRSVSFILGTARGHARRLGIRPPSFS
jgi:UDP-N-acetylglucosamine 2-epimerase (non-hydrolysing)